MKVAPKNRPARTFSEADLAALQAEVRAIDQAAARQAESFPKTTDTWQYVFHRIQGEIHAEFFEAMKAQGVTQAELARRLGVSRAWVSRVLSDPDENYQLETIAKIAHALGQEVMIKLTPRPAAVEAAKAPKAGGGKKKPAASKRGEAARPAAKVAAKPSAAPRGASAHAKAAKGKGAGKAASGRSRQNGA